MRGRISVFFILFFTTAILQGCATRTIKIDPIPELKTGSPLAGIEPLTFVVKEFEDARPIKKQVGACRVGPKIELDDQKVPEIINQAIVKELKRNGHKVLQPGEANKADVIIDGIVRGYWIQSNNYTFSITITGMVETELNITANKNEDKFITKTYRGNYQYETSGMISPSVWRDVINQALLDMIKEFTTDEKFLNRLKRVKKQGS